MAKTPGSDDPELLFLEEITALCLDIIDQANEIKEESDDPAVLYLALKMESAALVIRKRAVDYRPRLQKIKSLARSTGKDLRIRRRKAA